MHGTRGPTSALVALVACAGCNGGETDADEGVFGDDTADAATGVGADGGDAADGADDAGATGGSAGDGWQPGSVATTRPRRGRRAPRA